MWGMAPLHNLSQAAKYEALGRPSKMPISDIDNLWKPGELVRPIKVPKKLRTEQFYLGDFTLAMKVGDPVVPKGYPPMHFCSPDRLHKQDPNFPCDIWSYMILFGELYLSHPPFYFAREGGTVSAFVHCLGPLPKRWNGLYTHPDPLDFWYDQNTVPDPNDSLESVIERFRPDADPIEKRHVLSVMKKGFIYDPEKRPTAAQLLQDPSFRAIMERYGC
jgi:serine/threonine protein kinase